MVLSKTVSKMNPYIQVINNLLVITSNALVNNFPMDDLYYWSAGDHSKIMV